MESPFPVIKVEGTAYSCGEQHGAKAKKLIEHNIKYYLSLWERKIGLNRKKILEKASMLMEPIKSLDRELLQELQGIADGAGVALEEVVAINSRYEIVWSQMRPPSNGCTAAAALPEATKSKKTLLGQNWDYFIGVRDSCIILEILQENKPSVVIHTEAGIIGQKGINSEGIGLVVNALVSDKDSFEPKAPFWILCRSILNSHTLSQAMRVLLNTEKSVSSNMILGQAGGVAVDFESTPLDVAIILPEKGILLHANHFIGPRSLSVKDEFVKTASDSIYRYSRTKEYLEKRKEALTVESFMEIFRDHFGKPNSICCHEDQNIEEDYRGETLASVIFELESRKLLITRGPPCQSQYHQLKFQSLMQPN